MVKKKKKNLIKLFNFRNELGLQSLRPVLRHFPMF
jgi:hypothetical protein